jgi:hypothetical protein
MNCPIRAALHPPRLRGSQRLFLFSSQREWPPSKVRSLITLASSPKAVVALIQLLHTHCPASVPCPSKPVRICLFLSISSSSPASLVAASSRHHALAITQRFRPPHWDLCRLTCPSAAPLGKVVRDNGQNSRWSHHRPRGLVRHVPVPRNSVRRVADWDCAL